MVLFDGQPDTKMFHLEPIGLFVPESMLNRARERNKNMNLGDMMEWICLKCHRVFCAGEHYAKCCGEIEEFDVLKHGRLLIGSSNSWISIEKRWYGHPKLESISQELTQHGSYGAATHVNAFIESLCREAERK